MLTSKYSEDPTQHWVEFLSSNFYPIYRQCLEYESINGYPVITTLRFTGLGPQLLELNFSTLSGPSVPQLSLLCWYPYPASSTQTHICSLSKDVVLAQCNELLSAESNMNDLFPPWQTLSKAIDFGPLLPLTLFLGLISWHFYFFFQTRWQYFSINF